MHPYIGGFRAYDLFTVVAILLGTITTLLMAQRRGIGSARFALFQLAITAVAVLGAKAYSAITRFNGSVSAVQILQERGALRYPGGLLAALVALPILRRILPKVSLGMLADVMAPGIAVALAVMRLGCLCAGCCYGPISSTPWAIRFPRESPAWDAQVVQGLIPVTSSWSLPVEPLQLYFGIVSLSVAVWLVKRASRTRYDGELFLWFLALHETGKGLLEFLRQPEANQSVWHLQAVSLGLGALGIVAISVVTMLGAGRRRTVLSEALMR